MPKRTRLARARKFLAEITELVTSIEVLMVAMISLARKTTMFVLALAALLTVLRALM